jgi:hypothetical protein
MSKNELELFHDKPMDGLSFCRKAYALFYRIRSKPDGRERLRMRETVVEKKLIEEILPIARYIQFKYTVGRKIRVKWVNGNQTYDAVIQQKGALVKPMQIPEECHLEATCALHKKAYLSREHINNGNPVFGLDGLTKDKKRKTISSTPVVRKGLDFVHDFSRIVIASIEHKAAKKYPVNTILVVDCSLNTLYTDDEWRELVTLVSDRTKSHPFFEIFLCDNVLEQCATIPHVPRAA